MTDTVTVHVWQVDRSTRYDDLYDTEPDIYELQAGDPIVIPALSDDKRVILADSIDHHGTYGIDVPNDERPATVNVHTNDSYHDPHDWGDPIERGLTFQSPDDREPFGCELWGRVMMWVERPEE